MAEYNSKPFRRYLTSGEVEELYGIKKGTLAQWRYLKKGPPFLKPSHKVIRYLRDDIEKWLESNRVLTIDSEKISDRLHR